LALVGVSSVLGSEPSSNFAGLGRGDEVFERVSLAGLGKHAVVLSFVDNQEPDRGNKSDEGKKNPPNSLLKLRKELTYLKPFMPSFMFAVWS